MTWQRRRQRRSPQAALSALLAAATALMVCAALLTPAVASAKGGRVTPPGRAGANVPIAQGGSGGSTSIGSSGQDNNPSASGPDNTQLLGGRDPLCSNPAVLDAQGQRNCTDSGTPETAFPLGNFALDQHIDTGVTGFGNFVPNALQSVISLVFGLTARIVGAAILLVSLAFGFSLYDSDHAGHIPHLLASIEQLFTSPLLVAGLLAAGVWTAYQIAARRRLGKAIGGLAAMSLMLIGTLLLMENPHGTIDRFDQFTNTAAQFAVGAFSGHPSTAQPTSSYANATESLWSTMGEQPWCAMEFGDVSWCMAPMDTAMRQNLPKLEQALKQQKNNDGNGNTEPPPLQHQELCVLQAGSGCQQPPARPTDPKTGLPSLTNGELFLAFPTNDNARNGKNDPWTLYHTLLQDQPGLAQIRGSSGAGNRLFALVLCTVGMFFFLLLLIYIAINLLIAGMLFVILLLFGGIMAIVACLGDWGREKWLEWAGMTVGALVVKLLYSVYLGVMIGAAALMTAIGAEMGSGWAAQWLLFCVFWMLAFAFRHKLMGLFSPERAHHEHHRGIELAAAVLPAIAVARAGAGTARAVGRGSARGTGYALDRWRDSHEEKRWVADRQLHEAGHRAEIEAQRATGELADRRLNERARQMLDAHHRTATARVKTGGDNERQAAMLQQRGTALRNERLSGGLAAGAAQASPAARARDAHLLAEEQHAFTQAENIRQELGDDSELAAARQFVATVEENNRRTGRPYDDRQLADARSAVEQEILSDGERDYAHLAYRHDEGREGYEKADGDKREKIEAWINAQIDQDRESLGAVRRMPRRLDPPRPLEPPRPKRRQPHRYRQYGEFLGLERHRQ